VCANLAIKFNMIYISVYQLIKQHIEDETCWGKALMETQRIKELKGLKNLSRDDSQEETYTAANYKQSVVLDMIKATIMEKRTNQQYVILEGVCNSVKLVNEADRNELGLMDELLQIENNIGEIRGIIGLQYSVEPETIDEKDIVIQPAEVKQEEAKVEAPGEGAEGAEPAEANPEDGEKKAVVFNPLEYNWTMSRI